MMKAPVFFKKIAHHVNETGIYQDRPAIESLVYDPVTRITRLCTAQTSLEAQVSTPATGGLSAVKAFYNYALNGRNLHYPCFQLRYSLRNIQNFGGRFGLFCVSGGMLDDAEFVVQLVNSISSLEYNDVGHGYVQNVGEQIHDTNEKIKLLFDATIGIKTAFTANRQDYRKIFGK